MTHFHGKFGLPLLGAMLLLLAGLAGCGSEPAPVVQPPAPPPAPPPFQPQPVEVKSAGGVTVVTLMTAEGGGYTLNGEPFAGGEVENEGRMYALALEDGNWVATDYRTDAPSAARKFIHRLWLRVLRLPGNIKRRLNAIVGNRK